MADNSVTLSFPASSERVRLARTLVAVLGDEAGFDYDEVEDLRIAVDELCFAVLDSCEADGPIELSAAAEPGTLTVEATCTGNGSATNSDGPSELTRQILTTVVDSYDLVLDGVAPSFRFTKTKP